jgi:AcrR family transcriptional regulator
VAVAERLFAERGIDSVSLSEINRRAGQRNRAALQYHFGDKQGLIQAILDKHLPGIEQRRNRMLDELEVQAEPDLRSLVQALVLPVAEKLEDRNGGVSFVLLQAQLVGHPEFSLLELGASQLGAERIWRMTARACPSLPPSLRRPRELAVLGLLFHGIADYVRLQRRAEGLLQGVSRAVFFSNLVDSIVAILSVPVSHATSSAIREPSR